MRSSVPQLSRCFRAVSLSVSQSGNPLQNHIIKLEAAINCLGVPSSKSPPRLGVAAEYSKLFSGIGNLVCLVDFPLPKLGVVHTVGKY